MSFHNEHGMGLKRFFCRDLKSLKVGMELLISFSDPITGCSSIVLGFSLESSRMFTETRRFC